MILIIQLVDIFYSNVFRRYNSKYNIFRDLYEKDLLGLEIRDIDEKLAHRIKKIILSNKEICYSTPIKDNSCVDILALGSYGVFKELSKEIVSIGNEDLGFKIKRVIKNVNEYENGQLKINGKTYSLEKAYVMGIVNITPDSFSDGGNYFETSKAVDHALKLIEEGAEIIDIGGESTRPGSEPITADEEISRVIPFIEELVKNEPDVIISIDTTKSIVADKALSIGAKIVNDISSFSNDKKMLDVVKKHNAGLILMHMKGNPSNMQNDPFYEDVVAEVYDYLVEKTQTAQKHGIKNIIIDPGIGFGKRVMDNYELIKRLNEFKGIGFPILIGISRKSFLGKTLKLDVVERDDPTLAAETIAIKNGARIIRTHNVKKTIYSSLVTKYLENPEALINV